MIDHLLGKNSFGNFKPNVFPDELNKGVLVKPEVSIKIKEVQVKLLDFEEKVKKEIQAVETETQEVKSHPTLGIKRRLGRELLDLAS